MRTPLLTLALLATLATTTPLHADEIKLKRAKWDSLAIPLKITPFYLTLKTSSKAKKVSLVFDVYKAGTLSKTFGSVEIINMDHKPEAIDLKVAIYFPQAENGVIKGCVSIEKDGNGHSTGYFELPEALLPIHGGHMADAFPSQFTVPGKTPVFYIVANSGGSYSPADSPESLLQYNDKGSTLIAYLVTE